jgi:hypothetical protein
MRFELAVNLHGPNDLWQSFKSRERSTLRWTQCCPSPAPKVSYRGDLGLHTMLSNFYFFFCQFLKLTNTPRTPRILNNRRDQGSRQTRGTGVLDIQQQLRNRGGAFTPTDHIGVFWTIEWCLKHHGSSFSILQVEVKWKCLNIPMTATRLNRICVI